MPLLRARQSSSDDDGFDFDDSSSNNDSRNDGVWFWYTQTGIIVKWSILLGIVLVVFLYIILGRLHARRRMNKGLAPLGYHRWLVPRADLAAADPRYAYPETYGPTTPYIDPYASTRSANANYGMYAVPPPVYDANAPKPPAYYAGMMPMTVTREGGWKAGDGGDGGDDNGAQERRGQREEDGGERRQEGTRESENGSQEYQAPEGPPPSRTQL